MATERAKAHGGLMRVLEISREQSALALEGRTEELLRLQAEREKAIESLKSVDRSLFECDEVRRAAREILDNDSLTAARLESAIKEVAGRISKIRKGATAARAYQKSRP